MWTWNAPRIFRGVFVCAGHWHPALIHWNFSWKTRDL